MDFSILKTVDVHLARFLAAKPPSRLKRVLVKKHATVTPETDSMSTLLTQILTQFWATGLDLGLPRLSSWHNKRHAKPISAPRPHSWPKSVMLTPRTDSISASPTDNLARIGFLAFYVRIFTFRPTHFWAPGAAPRTLERYCGGRTNVKTFRPWCFESFCSGFWPQKSKVTPVPKHAR